MNSQPHQLASGQKGPRDLALDETHVYWTNYTAGTIARVAKDGGDVEVLAEGQVCPWRIAVDDELVYWVGECAKGALCRAPKCGGETIALAEHAHPSSVGTYGGSVFWISGGGQILRTDPRLATTAILAVTDAKPWRLTVGADGVYWTNANGTVMCVPLDGGDTAVLSTAQGDPRDIAMDDDCVYWTTFAGKIRALDKRTRETRTLFESEGTSRGIGLDERHVYWTEPNEGLVMRIPKAGGKPRAVASSVRYPINVTADGKSVFFTCLTGGVVMRVDL